MPNIRRHTHFTTVVDTPLGNEVELELPVDLNDWENPDITVRFTPNHIIVGYLAHDDSPPNPLDYSYGMGVIHHHPQSRYGRRDSDYYAALGCDSYGDPDAVLLDLYDHSGVTWSVSGSSMQCQWDTSRGESVWVPDQGAREEIDTRAPIYDHAVVHETNWLKGRNRKYRLEVDGKTIKESDDWIPLYHIAKEIARLRTKAGMPAWNNGRRTAACQLAANAAESYTDYCNGNAYGVVVAVYNMDGDLIEDDACWGYLGSAYAEECLVTEVEDMVERYAKRDAALIESEVGEI